MEANSSGLDNKVLLYVIVPDTYNQAIQRQIMHVIQDITFVEQDSQLIQLLSQNKTQMLIVVGNPIVALVA
jgi:hypothetical protein